MSVAKARENLKDARRNLADAIDSTSKSFLFHARSKQGKMKRAISTIDKALVDLRGL